MIFNHKSEHKKLELIPELALKLALVFICYKNDFFCTLNSQNYLKMQLVSTTFDFNKENNIYS